jgi:glycosyltransferase involved in cell wall biosynthesis
MRIAGYERNIEKIWATRHLLILPSRGEGTPLAAMEAMICGRPVLATDVGGNSEIIEDGVTGFIAEAPTIKSIASTLQRAWEHRSMWKEMGQVAHAKANEIGSYSPPKKILSILQVI